MRPDPLAAVNLLELAAMCGYPRLQPHVSAGEAAWRAYLHGRVPSTRQERARLLARLGRRHLLLHTPAGRARARRWIDVQRALPTRALRRDVRERVRQQLLYIGDVPLLPAIVEAFALVPACVRDVLLDEVVVLGVGAGSNAWTSTATFRDQDGRGRTRLIVMSGAGRTHEQVRDTTLHELGHAWLASVATGSCAMPALGEAAVWALAAADGWLARARAWERTEELRADALACAWREAAI